MSAYVVIDIEVVDPVAFDEYRKVIPASIAAHAGRYLARGGTTEVLEGDWQPRRLVILEFASADAVKSWYNSPDYQPLKALRKRASNASIVMIEGL